MSALRLMHEATRAARTSTLSAEQEREAPGIAAAVAFNCQLTPMDPRAAYDRFNVELERPFLVICTVADAEALIIGDVITVDGEQYVVKAPPAIYKGIGPADHGSMVCELSQES